MALTTDEALRRVRSIVPMLVADVQTAILSHAVLEASNDTIPPGMKGYWTEFNETYNAVQNALTLKLALDVARIFDISASARYPAEEQDKASVQVLAALLQRVDVPAELERAAAGWTPSFDYAGDDFADMPDGVSGVLKEMAEDDAEEHKASCRAAINAFVAEAARLKDEAEETHGALTRVREFRNKRLAHSLFDKEPDAFPLYSDLDLLLGIAKKAARLAKLAVEGGNTELEEQAARNRENAEGYAGCVLDGLKRASRPQA
ncbi:AbiU2 domain-containing protein [Rhizobium leguminosarum]